MLLTVAILQVLLLLAVLALLVRKPSATQSDPRQALLSDQLTRLHGSHDALHANLSELRRDAAANADIARESHDRASVLLRKEVLGTLDTLGNTLKTELSTFRADNREAASRLHADVHAQHEAVQQKLAHAATDARQHNETAREALHSRLTDLAAANTTHQERLRTTVEGRLDVLNAANSDKLEQMRLTVDEKLHATLHSRLTESFGQVTDQLNKVHNGLGEMSKLSEGVDDLSRIFTNVKSRGGFAEVQLGMLLEQMLAPSQIVRNARVKPNTQEVVEFGVRFPGQTGGGTILPIDAKFPREAWERLESAYTGNDPDLLSSAGRAFEAAIRTEGKRICEKYINPPVTTPHAIMFLPTEGLYAEVMRRDALQAEIQSKCQVTIAGPSTLSAILTSFQMGFHMLALQEKGDEVWKVLASAKTEFGRFGTLMDKVEGDVSKIQKTLGEVGVRTRAINRTLREVSDTDTALKFEDATNGTLRLVAEA